MSSVKLHKNCKKPYEMASKHFYAAKPLPPKVRSSGTVDDMMAPIKRMSMDIESKVETMKSEVVGKIDQEMQDSHNAREFISQKYNELCEKIKSLAEVESTVSSFRSEIRSLEKVIEQLALRLEYLERRNSGSFSRG